MDKLHFLISRALLLSLQRLPLFQLFQILLSKISHNPTMGFEIFLHQIIPLEEIYPSIPNFSIGEA